MLNTKKMFRSLFSMSFSLLLPMGLGYASTYKVDLGHSKVQFKVQHLVISSVTGRFNKFDGEFDFAADKKNLEKVDATVEVTSIDTNEPDRDKHLKGGDFFDVEKFPQMTFKSKKVSKGKGKGKDKEANLFSVEGDLTVKGVTKPVTMEVSIQGPITDPWGNEVVGFSGSMEIDRKDFGITWNKALDKGGVMVGEKVTIEVEGEGRSPKKP